MSDLMAPMQPVFRSGLFFGFDGTNVYGYQERDIGIPHRSTGLITSITYGSWDLYLCATL